jgi:F-type H+-transporting ATPase subunit gamma
MSEGVTSLSRKMARARDLQSVVRTMKAYSAASIAQYEQSVRALGDYYQAVELGLVVCLRRMPALRPAASTDAHALEAADVVVFGSDQGLVGQFNDRVAEQALAALARLPHGTRAWAVGERIHARLLQADVVPAGQFDVPSSTSAITGLVGEILLRVESGREMGAADALYLFHNRPQAGAIYAPVQQRVLPLDAAWYAALASRRWPTANLPEVLGSESAALRALIREYLFVSLFRACAESLASENATRLAAMQRAERNIDDLLDQLSRSFHRLRQATIDDELFDVVSGYQALAGADPRATPGHGMRG